MQISKIDQKKMTFINEMILILCVLGFGNAAYLQLNTCDEKNELQQWVEKTASNHSIIQLGSSSQCLDANPTWSGCETAEIPQTVPCDSANTLQWWKVHSIKNKTILAGYDCQMVCLKASDTSLGSRVVLDICGGELEIWKVDGKLIRLAKNLTMCLDAGSTISSSCLDSPFNSYPYCNKDELISVRVADVLSRATITEKVINLQSDNPGVPRLGLPPFSFSEALHGAVCPCGLAAPGSTGCATSFPHNLLLGGTFNRSLWGEIGSVISTEARALHNQGLCSLTLWAPDINPCRDPRWGRCQEVPSEDPFLVGEFVSRWSRGLQEGEDARYLKAVSTAKHFADYDLEGNGAVNRGAFDAIVNNQDQVEYYFPPFRAAVETAHVQSIMCAYNAVNGVPSCGNDLFQNGILRSQWGFDGFIVSDCSAIGDAAFNKYICEYYNCSVDAMCQVALEGGCDLNCGDFYAQYLGRAIKKNAVSLQDVDLALGRVWKNYFTLGLLAGDDPVYNAYGPQMVDSSEHRALALRAAEDGMVLLKNDPDPVKASALLPLTPATRVALLGPKLNSSQLLSIYRGPNTLVNEHTPWLSFLRGGANITGVEFGCRARGPGTEDGGGDPGCLDTSGFEAAASLAARAEVALVFVGLAPGDFLSNSSSDAREDEGWDRHLTTLPGFQEDLIRAVYAANPNTVVILIHGGSLSMSWTKEHVPAILDAHYPGELGGDAIFNTVYGKVSPAGRLTTTVYPDNFTLARNISDMNLRDRGGITYKYYQGTPQWAFGFGLSYSTFSFVPLQNAQQATTSDIARLHKALGDGPSYAINVTNTGSVASDVVVLGFVSSDHEDAVPGQELFDFARVYLAHVHLGAQQWTVVHLTVAPRVLSLVDREGIESIQPGRYRLAFGVEGSSEGTPSYAELQLTGERAVVSILPSRSR